MNRPSKHRSWWRQARASVMSGVAGFLLMQLGLSLLIETWWPHPRDPFYAFKADRLFARIDQTEEPAALTPAPSKLVLVLGSSRTANGLRGLAVEEELSQNLGQPVILFNLGEPGGSPLNSLVYLDRLLARGVTPDLLLVEVTPYFLSAASERELCNPYCQKYGVSDRSRLWRQGFSLDEIPPYPWTCWAVPTYGHRVNTLLLLLPDALPWNVRHTTALESRSCDASGWCAHPWITAGASTPEKRAAALSKSLAVWGEQLANFRIGGPFPAALEALLARCRQENLPVALILMPEGSRFRQLYPPGAWEQTCTLLTTYGLPIINAREWMADEDFLDGQHLLPDGATRFTQRLGREAILPLLRQQP
jgi:hypothetical protein